MYGCGEEHLLGLNTGEVEGEVGEGCGAEGTGRRENICCVEEEVVVAEEVAKEELELAEVVGIGCWLILMSLVWW